MNVYMLKQTCSCVNSFFVIVSDDKLLFVNGITPQTLMNG